jgi:hypothetical protein
MRLIGNVLNLDRSHEAIVAPQAPFWRYRVVADVSDRDDFNLGARGGVQSFAEFAIVFSCVVIVST